jgi:hypothetical protein
MLNGISAVKKAFKQGSLHNGQSVKLARNHGTSPIDCKLYLCDDGNCFAVASIMTPYFWACGNLTTYQYDSLKGFGIIPENHRYWRVTEDCIVEIIDNDIHFILNEVLKGNYSTYKDEIIKQLKTIS